MHVFGNNFLKVFAKHALLCNLFASLATAVA